MTGIPSPDVPEPAEALARWLAASDSLEAFAALHLLRSMQRRTPFTADRAAQEIREICREGSVPEAMATHREALGLDGPHSPVGRPAEASVRPETAEAGIGCHGAVSGLTE